MFAECDAVPNKTRGTWLFQESLPAIPFLEFQASTPCQKLQVPESGSTQYAPPALQWLHPAHPFVAATEKNVPHAAPKICYNAVIVLSVVL